MIQCDLALLLSHNGGYLYICEIQGQQNKSRKALSQFIFKVAVINTTTKSNLGDKRVYFDLQVIAHPFGSSGQELQQKQWKNAVSWLVH